MMSEDVVVGYRVRDGVSWGSLFAVHGLGDFGDVVIEVRRSDS